MLCCMYWVYWWESSKKKTSIFPLFSQLLQCLFAFYFLNTTICTKSIYLSTVVINCLHRWVHMQSTITHYGFPKCDTVYMVVCVCINKHVRFSQFTKKNVCICLLELNFKIISGKKELQLLNCTFVIFSYQFS